MEVFKNNCTMTIHQTAKKHAMRIAFTASETA